MKKTKIRDMPEPKTKSTRDFLIEKHQKIKCDLTFLNRLPPWDIRNQKRFQSDIDSFFERVEGNKQQWNSLHFTKRGRDRAKAELKLELVTLEMQIEEWTRLNVPE